MSTIQLPFDSLDVPEEVDMNILRPLLDHVMDLAGGDPVVFGYQLDWFAAVLQNREKLEVMLVYAGSIGVGKSILVTQLMARVFGAAFQEVLELKQLHDSRNEADNTIVGKLFCAVEELGPLKWSHMGFLKDVITGRQQRIERIGVHPFYVSMCPILFTCVQRQTMKTASRSSLVIAACI